MNSAAVYQHAFETERRQAYPQIDALEQRLGYAIDQGEMENAARVLACPVKAHAPSWQHGRVIYATARDYLARRRPENPLLLDVGTAKGYSALCLLWALRDSRVTGRVVSIDVIDPDARQKRNTVAEVDGLKTLREILSPWPESLNIEFVQGQSRLWLTAFPQRVHLAVIDGKHTYDAVSWDFCLLERRQQSGDVIIFDDLQIPGVMKAVEEITTYDGETLHSAPDRIYAIARKR